VALLLALDMQLDMHSKERLPFLKRIQQTHPGDFWVNLALADAVYVENATEEAIRYYQAAVSIRPQTALGHDKLGVALLRAGRTEEAVVSLRQAADLDPTNLTCTRRLAAELAKLGRHDEAIDRLQTTVRLNPDQVILRSDLGRILESGGRHVEAVAQLRQAVALQPKNLNIQRQFRDLLPLDSDERPKDLPPGRGFGRK
jgi:eukaryotic-like serine/threonine-protein kinase